MDKGWKEFAQKTRQDIINMLHYSKAGHTGGSLSCVDILTVLYNGIMNVDTDNHENETRDRFVMSKGHGAPALYATLANRGFFDWEELFTLRRKGSRLQGHPDMKKLDCVDASTGSLGHGASVSVGLALGSKLCEENYNVYTLLGDGEMQEGQVWEAMMAGAHYNLDNLTFILDYNKLQIDGNVDDVMSLGDIKGKVKAFGWDCTQINGHDFDEIFAALSKKSDKKPKFIIANTIKGKGVSFAENVASWHGRTPNTEEAIKAMKELGGGELYGC